MNPLEEPGRTSRTIDPCVLVIFGATGDLTGRRLVPAIYQLGREGLLPSNFACVGFARRPKTDEQFRGELKEDIIAHSRTKPIDETFWQSFQEQIFYHQSDFDVDEGYQNLARRLSQLDTRHGTRGNRIFYLSVPPKYFPLIIEKLRKSDDYHYIIEEVNANIVMVNKASINKLLASMARMGYLGEEESS